MDAPLPSPQGASEPHTSEDGPLRPPSNLEQPYNALSSAELHQRIQRAAQMETRARELVMGNNKNINAQPAVKEYEEFFLTKHEIGGHRVNPWPITASMVVIFMRSVENRPRYKPGARKPGEERQWLAGTTISNVARIKYLNSLEHHRKQMLDTWKEEYPTLVQMTPLLSDPAIKAMREVWARTNADDVQLAQTKKSSGTLQEKATPEDRRKLQDVALNSAPASRMCEFGSSMRSWAMFAYGAANAMRGDNERGLLWSDIGKFDVAIPGLDRTIPSLLAVSRSGKTNKHGRIEQSAIFRSRRVEECGVFAIAFMLHFVDSNLKVARPEFAPRFDAESPNGYRQWYDRLVFPTAIQRNYRPEVHYANIGVVDMHAIIAETVDGVAEQQQQIGNTSLYRLKKRKKAGMSYKTHHASMSKLMKEAGICKTKKTHVARQTGARVIAINGASEADNKAHDHWAADCAFRQSLAAAGFDGNKGLENYFVPRAEIDPPSELMSQIFPWVEAEEDAYKERRAENSRNVDQALEHFLLLLKWFRVVLLQDAAVLRGRHPTSALFTMHPFHSPIFSAWADNFASRVSQIEKESAARTQNLPSVVAQAMANLAAQISTAQTQASLEIVKIIRELSDRVEDLAETVADGRPRKRKRADQGVPTNAGQNPEFGNIELTLSVARQTQQAMLAAQSMQRQTIDAVRQIVHQACLGPPASASIPQSAPPGSSQLHPPIYASQAAPPSHEGLPLPELPALSPPRYGPHGTPMQSHTPSSAHRQSPFQPHPQQALPRSHSQSPQQPLQHGLNPSNHVQNVDWSGQAVHGSPSTLDRSGFPRAAATTLQSQHVPGAVEIGANFQVAPGGIQVLPALAPPSQQHQQSPVYPYIGSPNGQTQPAMAAWSRPAGPTNAFAPGSSALAAPVELEPLPTFLGSYMLASAAPSLGRPGIILKTPSLPAADDRIAQMQDLVNSYGSKIDRMTFEWHDDIKTTKRNNGKGLWIPRYDFASRQLGSLADLVREWTDGANGELGLRQIEERWGAAWRKDTGTSFARRQKVMKVVDEIRSKRNWSYPKTVEYLNTVWNPHSVRGIATLIEKDVGKVQQASWIAGSEKFSLS